MIEITDKIKLYNEDNLRVMAEMDDESIDVILTDPPYLYLKNQKLERAFDEQLFFSECKRVLKKDGFIVLFGRGTSFYRWNTILDNLDFVFKEEVIWDKRMPSNPFCNFLRVHETVSIFTKNKGTINKSFIPYLENREYNIDKLISDINRLLNVLNNFRELNEVKIYLENNIINNKEKNRKSNYNVTAGKNIKQYNVSVGIAKYITKGLTEQSIISLFRDHYSTIHPTQKPVRLMERLLNLTVKSKDAVVFDPFAGSCPVAVACHNLSLNFIGCEVDKEYFNNAVERLKVECSQQKINY